jgi:hypothetical protein
MPRTLGGIGATASAACARVESHAPAPSAAITAAPASAGHSTLEPRRPATTAATPPATSASAPSATTPARAASIVSESARNLVSTSAFHRTLPIPVMGSSSWSTPAAMATPAATIGSEAPIATANAQGLARPGQGRAAAIASNGATIIAANAAAAVAARCRSNARYCDSSMSGSENALAIGGPPPTIVARAWATAARSARQVIAAAARRLAVATAGIASLARGRSRQKTSTPVDPRRVQPRQARTIHPTGVSANASSSAITA